MGVNRDCPCGHTGDFRGCDEGWWGLGETWTTRNPARIHFVGGSVPSRHLSPDEDASGPFNFLLTNAFVLSALGSTRLWLSPQQEVLSLFLHLPHVPPRGYSGWY